MDLENCLNKQRLIDIELSDFKSKYLLEDESRNTESQGEYQGEDQAENNQGLWVDAKYLVLSSPNGQLFYCGKNYDDCCNKNQLEELDKVIKFMIFINFLMQIATILSGIYCYTSLKVNIYKLHSILIMCTIFFTLPPILYNKLQILSLVFLIFCYFLCKGLESTIYNSIVYDNLKKIEEPGLRLEYLNYFRNIRNEYIEEYDHVNHMHIQINPSQITQN